jgi:glycosyltransferase involved in cell wall biosynthesis
MGKYKIAVYTIALNEEKHVKRWFDSAHEADLLVIADTGSTDKTRFLAKSLGISVTEIVVNPWRFDVARNASLALIPEDFDICIQLDMDEVLPAGWRKKIEDAYDEGNKWPLYIHVTSRDEKGNARHFQHYFKIHPRKGFHWKYPIHEVLVHEPNLTFERKVIDLEVDHIKDESKSRKSYLDLLEKAVQEEPSDWRMNHYLNREYFYNHDWLKVLQTAYRCEDIQGGWDVERASTYMWASEAAHHLNMPPLAEEWARKATDAAPHFYEVWHWRAHIAHLHGKWDECLDFSRRRLTLERQSHHLVKPEVWEWWGYDLIALSSYKRGLHEDAAKFGKIAIEANPKNERLQRNLAFYLDSRTLAQGNQITKIYVTREELVSLITPTRNRDSFLFEQYQNLVAQTHYNWEWLILDDSNEKSAFARNCLDARVKYIYCPHASPLSIGEKRNHLISQANGNLIAHIDDDDVYAVDYLKQLLSDFSLRDVDLIYLNSWFFIDQYGEIGKYSSSKVLPRIEGWGFSYFYNRHIWDQIKFPANNWEDHFWFQEVVKKFNYIGFDDQEGLALKRVHRTNSSRMPFHLVDKVESSKIPSQFRHFSLRSDSSFES